MIKRLAIESRRQILDGIVVWKDGITEKGGPRLAMDVKPDV